MLLKKRMTLIKKAYEMNLKNVVRDPIDLLTHVRFDVPIKYLYASNLSSDFYKKRI